MPQSPQSKLQYPADFVVDDVDSAVQAALHRTRSALWHSMR